MTATLTAAGDASTEVTVTTDLNITGKPAQFGRGVMQDVSDKLLGQFASCLETKLGGRLKTRRRRQHAAPAEAAVEETPIAAEAAAAAEADHPERPRTTPRRGAAAELDLGATMLPVLIKRFAGPLIAGHHRALDPAQDLVARLGLGHTSSTAGRRLLLPREPTVFRSCVADQSERA